MSLLLPLTTAERVARAALRPGLDSSGAVAAVGRLDGRARVIAVRDRNGWRRATRQPWTASSAEQMRRGTISEVLLRRRFRRARVLLAWLPTGTARP